MGAIIFSYELFRFLYFRLGKIVTLVPKLSMKGQLRPSTFKVVNLVPQLSFLGQIRPCIGVVLHISTRLMQKIHFTLGSSMLNMYVLILS
jgi:hypothetical protein